MSRLRDWIRKVREKWRWANTFYEQQFRVALFENGFRIYYRDGEPPVARVEWSEVRAIRTYKLDVYAYEIIFLAIQIAPDHWIEIGEYFIGSSEIFEQVSRRFPLSDENWYQTVMLPPFAPNDTLLWRRSDEDGEMKDEMNRVLVHLRPRT